METFTTASGETFYIVNNKCEVTSYVGYECGFEVQLAESKATAEYLASK